MEEEDKAAGWTVRFCHTPTAERYIRMSTKSGPAVEFTKRFFSRLKRKGQEGDDSHPPNAEVKNDLNYLFPLNVFVTWSWPTLPLNYCIIKILYSVTQDAMLKLMLSN
jgi:hypothetical protein